MVAERGESYDDYLSNLQRKRFNKSAFELHQSVERLYHTMLLVYTMYSPHSHNIVVLRHAAEMHDPLLYPAWPRERQEEVDLFEKLQQAYVKARYQRDYHITDEQLEKLRSVTSG